MPVPFAAIAGLASALFPDNTQNQLLGMQISEQKNARRNAERMAKSTRKDANGNVTRYSESEGWITEAAPLIKAILDAQNKEQLKGFTEDAPRARDASVRKDNRSKAAGAEYDEKFAQRTRRNERSEGDYQAEAILSAARKQRKGAPNGLYTNALRSGNPAMVKAAAAAGNGAEGDLTDAINAARKTGTGEFLSERSQRDQVDFGELGQLGAVANGTDPANLTASGANEQLAGEQGNAIQQLMAAIQQGGQGVAGAYGNAASQYQPKNIGDVINAFGELFPAKQDPQAAALAKALQDAEMSKALYDKDSYDYRRSMNTF